MTGNDHRYLRWAAFGAVAALAAVSCTRPGTPPKTTTTTRANPTTSTTMGSHGGMDHSVPDRLNHAPTEQQKKDALDWVQRTRAAVKRNGITLAYLQNPKNGYLNIGDGVHWVKPEFTRDALYDDVDHIESFAVFGGVVSAAMYVYNSKGLNTTINDVPDIAGNWTMWHNHVLPYKSDDPMNNDFFRLGVDPKTGKAHMRTDSPMIHVWIVPNKCGPFASAGVGEGSCIAELKNY